MEELQEEARMEEATWVMAAEEMEQGPQVAEE